MTELLRQLLIEEEGWRHTVYVDSVGVLTIGCGRNLVHRGLSDQEIDGLLVNDMREVQAQAQSLAGYAVLNDVQKAVVCSLVFQIGIAGVSKFKNMLDALASGDVKAAAEHGLKSRWAEQTPRRALRQMQMLSTGLWMPR